MRFGNRSFELDLFFHAYASASCTSLVILSHKTVGNRGIPTKDRDTNDYLILN